MIEGGGWGGGGGKVTNSFIAQKPLVGCAGFRSSVKVEASVKERGQIFF